MQNLQYYIETYGCQMNIYDSELVAGLLEKCGYSETRKINNADAVFLNTCAIREKAEDTVHNRLNHLQYLKKKKPGMILGILGCMAQNLKNELLESKPYVDVILGPDTYRLIPDIVRQRQNQNTGDHLEIISKLNMVMDMLPFMHIYLPVMYKKVIKFTVAKK